MNTFLIAIASALWLGILTSISPCPLATNIAAISYIGRQVEKTRLVLLAGLLYTLGRTLAYVGIALLVTQSMQLIPGVSLFLQKYMNLAVGPLLIVVGVLLLDIFSISFGGGGVPVKLQNFISRLGLWGAGILGFVFALTFCPVSAGIFFGALIPLAVKNNITLIPIFYGVGTALPVIGFSFIITFAAQLVGLAFKRLSVIELWMRKGTAIVMIALGVYLIIKQLMYR